MFIKGYCPTLQREHEIYVKFDIKSRYLVEGTQNLLSGFECDSTRQCSNPNECPICKSVISQLKKVDN